MVMTVVLSFIARTVPKNSPSALIMWMCWIYACAHAMTAPMQIYTPAEEANRTIEVSEDLYETVKAYKDKLEELVERGNE